MITLPTRSNQVIGNYRVLGVMPSGSFVIVENGIHYMLDPRIPKPSSGTQFERVLSVEEAKHCRNALLDYIQNVLGVRTTSEVLCKNYGKPKRILICTFELKTGYYLRFCANSQSVAFWTSCVPFSSFSARKLVSLKSQN